MRFRVCCRITFEVMWRNVVWNRKIFQTRYTWTLCFCSEIENKTHIVNIAWWLRFKYMRIMQSIFSNPHPKKIQRGGGGGCVGPAGAASDHTTLFFNKTIGIPHDENMLAVYERNSWISLSDGIRLFRVARFQTDRTFMKHSCICQ